MTVLFQPSTAEVALERDIFTYRAYMAQNKFLVVMDEIKPHSSEKVQPLRLLAEYLSSPSKRDSVLNQLEQKLAVAGIENETLVLSAATIYMKEQNYEAAYRVLHTVESLEAIAFIVDILLKLDRVDLARKKLKEMQEKDDDATLTQLVQAWVNVAMVADFICHFSCLNVLLNGRGEINCKMRTTFIKKLWTNMAPLRYCLTRRL